MDEHTTPRPWPRPRRASLLWAAAALLLVYSAAIALTGGIDLTVAGLRVRSRTWQRPALFGLALLVAVAVTDRRRAAFAARQARDRARRWAASVSDKSDPRMLAFAASVWALVAGVAFGTYTAGGADSSGYLNQARLFARARVVDDARLPPAAGGKNRTYALAPLGFRPTPDAAALAPSYPPGYPLLMAPAFIVDERLAHLVVPICGALAIWLTFALGRRLGEATAGGAAALITSVSPTFLFQVMQPMSDVPATAAWLLALCLAMRGTRASAALAGLSAGIAILIRPNLLPLALIVSAACAASGPRADRWQRVAASMLTLAPALVVLGWIQGIRYGSPLASGYGATGELFRWANVGPNLMRYPRWMFETHTPLLALFLVAPLWIVRRPAPTRPLLLWTFATAVVLAYLPYIYFQPSEWMYTRFFLPGLPIMWLLVAIPAWDVLRRLRASTRAIAAAAALAGMVGFSIRAAEGRSVFDLRRGETKYVRAAAYVRRALPANAVIVSMQHSGSLWFYTTQPIVRWDYMEPREVDRIVESLAAQGRGVFLVVDHEEFEAMRARFGAGGARFLQRLHPAARFGPATVYALN
jgi:hypothetical protein